MPLVVGIDEAGYGPLLGPLVVGATLWQVEPQTLTADYWQQLDHAVCRKPSRHDGRLPVNDSKQLYNRKKGIAVLERSVLAFATTAGLNCATLDEFLHALGTPIGGDPPASPWYHDLTQSLPVDPVRAAYAAIAARLRNSMTGSGVRCCGLQAQVVIETAYNDRVDQTRNKASVLLEQVLRLIQQTTAAGGDQDVYVHVDRLGGRQNYRGLLLTAFPERHLHVQEVTDEHSRYRLASQSNDWIIDFSVDADQQYLPVALASMLAKYLRELLMRQFNAFWCELIPELRPTAGYYSDARRFLAEIQPVLARAGLRAEQFVRRR